MNQINPKKLLRSKWTAVNCQNKEKHFIVTEVELDEEGVVELCIIEPIVTKRARSIDWMVLKDPKQWLHGWK
ncbi:TIGR02450 family Trp-rich protein [Vibrio comitans]